MPSEITMPQLSDTMTEGTVVKWHKKEGDKVKAGEEIADVETDKATMPMESFESGTLAVIAAPEGQKVKVGDRIAVIARTGENLEEVRKEFAGNAKAVSAPKTQAPPAATDMEQGHPAREAQVQAGRNEVTHSGGRSAEAVAESAEEKSPQPRGESERIKVSPLARKMAEERGIDLSTIRGSGPGGRIIQRDVEAAGAAAGQTAAPAAPKAQAATASPARQVVARGQRTVVTMSKIRSAIAAALQRSKQQVPHFYETIDIDMEAVASLRERLNKRLEKQNVRLSVMDFVYKATATALLEHPALNARLDAQKNEITQFGDVNLGIAVAIPEGLIVPVLRGIDQLTLPEIRQRSVDLFERARGQRLKREEMSEATFTVSPLGTYGIREFSAIINPPEVGILAVGSAEKRAVVRDGAIVARLTMTVTLSADHRAVDGATAAEFLRTLRDMLEEPALMLI